MLLDSLLELVEKLRKRIDAHSDALTKSEALTRYALIDPMLRELGWDTEDPTMVRPEYPLRPEYSQGTRFADYALLADGKPMMMLEAKSLGTPLRDQVLAQGINYCQVEGTKYFAVTDGQYWEVYETHRAVPIDQKRVVEFDLKGQSPAEACLQALALWRPSVESGHVVAGSVPVTGRGNAGSNGGPPSPPPSAPDDHEWQPLSELNPAPKSAPPTAVRFPDNSTAATTAWNAMLVETVRWLMGSKHLSTTHCPVQLPGSKRYVVADRPIHPEDKKFFASAQVGSLYVEKNLNLSQMVNATRFIVTRVGQDPSKFKVRFSAST